MSLPSQVPLTGAQHDIADGDYRATVTELGAGLRRLSYRGRPVIIEYAADELPPAGAGQLLAPWPNRVDHGRYSFDGASHQLDLSEPAGDNAIHGLTRWTSWAAVPPGTGPADASTLEASTLEASAPGASTAELRCVLHGQPGYPFCLELSASYRLSAEHGLEVSVTARNAGSRPAPYGTGQHPYLTAGSPLVDECELQLPVTRWLAADDRGIPVGDATDIGGTPFDFREPRVIGDTRMDHAFTGLDRDSAGRAWVRLIGPDAEVRFWAGEGYHWLQAFTGDPLGSGMRRRALAVEPMTCPPNALVTGRDLLRLEPGDSVTHTWGIQVRIP